MRGSKHHSGKRKALARGLSAVLFLGLYVSGSLVGFAHAQLDDIQSTSVLNPNTADHTRFSTHIDAIDPTAASNPKGASSPGFRGENQLVIYTPAFGAATGTNAFGEEATVNNGRITAFSTGNTLIPPDGFVISGHGQAGIWMKNTLQIGQSARFDPDNAQVTLEMTPEVYLYQVDNELAQARQNPPTENDSLLNNALQAAESCRDQLARLMQANPAHSSLWPQWTQICLKKADVAYYQSVPSDPNELRGIWVRAVEHNPVEVAQTVAQLKALGITQVFLETYYQGLTLYPSQVMRDYGLPDQHGQFKGWDPLQAWADALHANGMKLHVWVQTFFAGDTETALEAYGPILQKYPDWRNVQRSAVNRSIPVPSSVETGHLFLDPANPDVQSFLDKLLTEILTQYHPDGLNLDYIRYPASISPLHNDFLSTTWGYTLAARQAFQKQLNEDDAAARQKKADALKAAYAELKKPVPAAKLKAIVTPPKDLPNRDPVLLTPGTALWTRWVDWRKAQVTQFVHHIHDKALALNPQILISAVVFLPSDVLNQVKLQDWPRWVKEGDIAALTPIGLEEYPAGVFEACRQYHTLTQDKVPVYPGVFAMYSRQTPTQLIQEITTLHQAHMPGFVLFEKSRLTPEYRDALKRGPFRE